MKDDHKTKKQLIHELTELRTQNAELKKSVTGSISAELVVEEASRYAESIVETVREPLLVLDADLKIISANPNFYRTFKVTPGETIGSFIYDLGNKQWDIPKLRKLLEEVLPEKQAFDDFEVDHNFEDIGYKILLLNARQIHRKDIGAKMILLAIEDITEHKQVGKAMQENEERFRLLFENMTSGSAIYSVINDGSKGSDYIIESFNKTSLKIEGKTSADVVGRSLFDLRPTIDSYGLIPVLKKVWETGEPAFFPTKIYEDEHFSNYYENYIFKIPSGEVVTIYNDVTENKLVEEELKRKESYNYALFEYNPDQAIAVDLEGKIVAVNLAKRISGDRLPEIGDVMYRDYASNHEIDMYSELMACLGSGMLKVFPERKYRGKILSISIAPFSAGAVIISHDITERKRVDDELRSSTKDLRESQRIAHLGSWRLNMATNQVVWSEALYKMYGFDLALPPPPYTEHMKLFAPESWERLSTALANTRETGIPYELELETVRIDESKGWMWVRGETEVDSEGKTVGLWGAAQDITERKQTEESLKESERRYRLLADNANDVIFVLDMNLDYTYISPSVKILRGYEPEEVLKQPSFEIMTPASQDLAMRTLSEVLALEQSELGAIPISRTLQLEITRKDGTTVWTEVKVSFIRDENQRPVGILGVTREITKRKRAEEELQRTLESLRKSFAATIQVLVSAVETRDPYTAGHQFRVANLASVIATDMGLSQETIEAIRMSGPIHDIGKLSIPAEILSKPTKLSELEFAIVKEHSNKGFEMLKDVESPWPLAEIVYQHHERMDGSGYPRHLKGEEILMEARILAVADVVESMASHRPYRPAQGLAAALAEIENNKGTLYEADAVDACLRLFREKGFQFEET